MEGEESSESGFEPSSRPIEEEEEEEEQQREDPSLSEQRQRWQEEQEALKGEVVLSDRLPLPRHRLRYVAGVDVSFLKEHPSVACGALVLLDMLHSPPLIYHDSEILTLTVPYIPGFLAFRECPLLLRLLRKLRRTRADVYPHLLMVDGNGILHPRAFGLACHLGVLADIPTIGVAKSLHHVDGLCKEKVRAALEADAGRAVALKGRSGQILGMALRSHAGCRKPIFVSPGHRVSLETAVELVQLFCKYRIPEPVRQADIKSREMLRLTFGK